MKDESLYNGIVVVNKPSGMTSHDVVSRVRRILRMKRVGHAGTLDPLATGVLIILLGRCTKLFKEFEAYDK
ncbi:MAG TPA: tRNA pseudouridine(55) synthase TruB, partial [Candidatus Omnitrophota bacterium]|nr:tRNA pseudouridine(55) synthase TruB [Candidatus Omnitrophota bacterium]